jgi:hypothetical protein
VEIIRPPIGSEKTSRAIDFVWISRIPQYVSDDLRSAHQLGNLARNLKHWTQELDSKGLLDKGYVAKLKQLEKEITGFREKDQPVLDKTLSLLGELRPGKLE